MKASLCFLADLPLYDEEQPYVLHGFPEDVGANTNCIYETVSNIEVRDLRDDDAQEQNFLLPECGFQFHYQPSTACHRLRAEVFEDNKNKGQVAEYLRETTQLAMEALNAPRALCIDWRFRRARSTSRIQDQLDELENARHQALAPAAVMHCDYSYAGGLTTLQKHLTADEFQDVLGGRGRYRIVNVWRPLCKVDNCPLVFCDRRTAKLEDALEMDQVSPMQVEKSMVLKYRPSQKWFWVSDQLPEEVILFTSWDSIETENVLRHTPHGAFVELDRAGHSLPQPRESVEVRLVVMWKE